MKKACVFGAGAWGTALAQYLASINFNVNLVVHEEETTLVDAINKKNENIDYLPKIKLSENIYATFNAKEGVNDANIILFVVPTPFLRSFANQIHPILPKNVPIVNCSKGIENETLLSGSEILEEELPGKYHPYLTVLSGPNFAREISIGLPANTTIASKNLDSVKKVQELISSKYFRCYTTDDVIGVEIGGALKNVIAIAAGASDGMKMGESARAGLITRGLAEMSRLSIKRCANPLTLSGLSGIGDLMLTCSSSLSRNRNLGYEIGCGKDVDEIIKSKKSIAEGFKTSKSIFQYFLKTGIDMPISMEVYKVLHEKKSIKEAVSTLLSRPTKNEIIN